MQRDRRTNRRLRSPASCGLEPGRVVAYKPLLDQAIALSANPPEKCLIVQREQLPCDLTPGRDLDINGQREKVGGPTFAAITARSFHPGGVNVLLGDGSVRFVKSSIAGATWRSLGTVSGGEVIDGDSY